MTPRLSVRIFALAAVLCTATPALAHPVPFSYVDVRIDREFVDLTLVAHVFDVAHELGVDPPERLLETGFVLSHADTIIALLNPRLQLRVDGTRLEPAFPVQALALSDRQSIQLRIGYRLRAAPGMIALEARLFPYDPAHQTFVNVFDGASLTSQSILDRDKPVVEYFPGTRQGVLAVMARFVAAGIHHILIGPDHLLFLVGLMLLGGSLRRLAAIVSAFTIAHSVTLSLAALNLVTPPARLIEPAIALSIVYVGLDNLLTRSGRDMRAWIAFAFGFIHGFGFANVLREMNLPRTALGWSLFSFNVGVEIGQLLVVIVVATALAWLRANNEAAGRRLAYAGSIGVVAAGAFWFVQRVFFPGGFA
jgi:hydrogenase/urease accessory protein HupE